MLGPSPQGLTMLQRGEIPFSVFVLLIIILRINCEKERRFKWNRTSERLLSDPWDLIKRQFGPGLVNRNLMDRRTERRMPDFRLKSYFRSPKENGGIMLLRGGKNMFV